MSKITQESNGSYHWDCSIDTEYHKESGRKGLWGVLFLCVFVLVAFFIATGGGGGLGDLWIPLLVIGVILVIAVPLLLMWNSAGDPHEQYEMTEEYVKSGYSKSAIYSEYKKTEEVVFTDKYIEMCGKYGRNRIYVPEEDMEFVREFILKRLPEGVQGRKK